MKYLFALALLLLLASASFAALPQTLTVAGAGTAAINGSYTLSTSQDNAGNLYYIGPSGYYLFWYNFAGPGNGWGLSSNLDNPYSGQYIGPASSASVSPAGLSYNAQGGAAPAPTVTAPSPTSPTGVIASGSASTLFLSWTASGASSYNIYRGVGSGSETLLKNVSSASYSDSTVSTCTTYYMYVTAVNSSGQESGRSSEVSAALSGCSGTGTGGGPTGGGTTPAASSLGLTPALTWNKGVLTITYAGQDSFVQCSWPGGSYTSGDGATLVTPPAQVLSPAPPPGSSVVVFGKNTTRMVLTVQTDTTTAPVDNVTTTVGGDGFVPSGTSAPKHDPGSLKIGFGSIGSISIPSGWWSEVITYASQLAMEAEGMTLPQISAAMAVQAQSIITANTAALGAIRSDNYNIANDAYHERERLSQDSINDADNNADNASSDGGYWNGELKNQIVATEQQWKVDFVSTTQSIYTPQPATLTETQNLLNQFLTWGPYQFVINTLSLFQMKAGTSQTENMRLQAHDEAAPGDTIGPIAIHVPAFHETAGVTVTGGGLNLGQAGQWYDTGQTVPFQFGAMTSAPAWGTFRLLLGGGIHVMFIGIFIKLFWPKAHF